MAFDTKRTDKDSNPDAITGAPGSHPVGTGVGAAAGGAAAGAVAGTIAGPVGTVVGAVAGAVAGGLGGKAVAEKVDPTTEDAYWQKNHASRPYYEKGKTYTDYAPAYKYGWESSQAHSGKSFDEVEPHLKTGWEKSNAGTGRDWAASRAAVRDAYDRVGTTSRASTTGLESGTIAVPVTEERLQVGKQQVEKGGVRVSTHVEERPVEAQVNLREEHVSVNRRPVDRPASEADFDKAAAGNLSLTETAERAVVGKTARVVEEVEIGKTATERTETVRDTVRRTDVDVERVDAGSAKTNVDQATTRGTAARTKDASL
ncbi:MAG: hypothetical protein JWO31_413 [Phycisphaerales bacterium]|nr:hypothetical protein [Phycisphaerales bacterium]